MECGSISALLGQGSKSELVPVGPENPIARPQEALTPPSRSREASWPGLSSG